VADRFLVIPYSVFTVATGRHDSPLAHLQLVLYLFDRGVC